MATKTTPERWCFDIHEACEQVGMSERHFARIVEALELRPMIIKAKNATLRRRFFSGAQIAQVQQYWTRRGHAVRE